ncbi:hypothetical protein EPN90_01645 [Patescibacteria group bacterium]|nr:MAG: hypothetical protein EPN90_01645 [Patescibacteria group bacterium]
MSLSSFFKKQTEPPKRFALGAYRVEVVSHPEEVVQDEFLPIELRYLFRVRPETRAELRDLLARGYAIGVRTTTNTPERVLHAIQNIAVYSQKNCILTWLPQFLRDKHRPQVSDADRAQAERRGVNLVEDLDVIERERVRFKRLVLVDEDNVGIGEKEQRLMTDLSETLYPLSVDWIVHRVVNDNAHERTAIAQNIIKALLIIGPIAHVLEKLASGIGKVFAASADDLLGETAELMALRGSGFTWRELARRGRILIPVFALATWGAFSVEPLIHQGRIALAGIVFGLSAVALSLTTAIQSIGMYHKNVKDLATEGKARLDGHSAFRMALIQDFTNPARLGLFVGAAIAPLMGMIAAFSGLMSNGWVLAAVGSTESIVAGLTVIFANRLNEWRFARGLHRRIGRVPKGLHS